ncbi:hypothetical protein [Rhodopseudomonas pseudopalustris]|uniref:hypothetical protein n=1 Tax=Rhodopseudomonas pseudopalustris TaxID=1513892 RepID=UPI0015880B75|nr:hypothetical protein [Rhodopseudomonas pseudopalustris]
MEIVEIGDLGAQHLGASRGLEGLSVTDEEFGAVLFGRQPSQQRSERVTVYHAETVAPAKPESQRLDVFTPNVILNHRLQKLFRGAFPSRNIKSTCAYCANVGLELAGTAWVGSCSVPVDFEQHQLPQRRD